jgi:hypothetical protein
MYKNSVGLIRLRVANKQCDCAKYRSSSNIWLPLGNSRRYHLFFFSVSIQSRIISPHKLLSIWSIPAHDEKKDETIDGTGSKIFKARGFIQRGLVE